ncbi:hypothetical protein M0R45_018912 [Rubus argutus]|uniref:Uncharacterized protein n=1 Tax=Rubus argutus TaxID=59490 RepID=A0AAW1X5T7_RUBAR
MPPNRKPKPPCSVTGVVFCHQPSQLCPPHPLPATQFSSAITVASLPCLKPVHKTAQRRPPYTPAIANHNRRSHLAVHPCHQPGLLCRQLTVASCSSIRHRSVQHHRHKAQLQSAPRRFDSSSPSPKHHRVSMLCHHVPKTSSHPSLSLSNLAKKQIERRAEK